jgi:DNA-binding NarL/FixJ family response regulator
MRSLEGKWSMSERLAVFVYAADPISQAGIASQLRSRPEILVVDNNDLDAAAVAVVSADQVDEETTRVVRAIQREGCPRVVLVVARLDDVGLLAAVEAGASGIVRRSDAVLDRLVAAILAAARGDGTVPPDMLGRLLEQVGQLQRHVLAPRGLTLSGLSEREVDVLKLVADGMDTADIALKLSYSERTVKNVIHDITTRLQLRNRSHAVAYAVRQGLI